MEDHRLPITVGQGAGARVVTLELPPVHARRRDHPHGPADDAAARPLRHPGAPGALRASRSWRAIVRRSARILEIELEPDGARRDRRAQPRHAARGQPPAQAGARLRRGAHGRRRHGRGGARPRSSMLEVDELRARPPRPRDPATRSARSSPAARWASRRWRSRSGRSRTRSRTSTSPTCCSRA